MTDLREEEIPDIGYVLLEDEETGDLLWFLLILPFLCLIGYISGRYFRNHFRNEKIGVSEARLTYETHPDFVQQAKSMLDDAERFYSEGRVKDAFEKISQAIRFYFSRKFSLNREITANELLSTLRSTDDFNEYSKIEECLELCNLVEFAKYSPDENDFRRALDLAWEIIFNHGM